MCKLTVKLHCDYVRRRSLLFDYLLLKPWLLTGERAPRLPLDFYELLVQLTQAMDNKQRQGSGHNKEEKEGCDPIYTSCGICDLQDRHSDNAGSTPLYFALTTITRCSSAESLHTLCLLLLKHQVPHMAYMLESPNKPHLSKACLKARRHIEDIDWKFPFLLPSLQQTSS